MHSLPPTSRLRIPGYRHIQDPQLIGWLEGRGNYTVVHLKSSPKPLMTSQTLKCFELHLPGFVRVSRSSLVNPSYIRKVIQVNTKMMSIELINDMTLTVSRRRILDTLTRLKFPMDLMVEAGPATP